MTDWPQSESLLVDDRQVLLDTRPALSSTEDDYVRSSGGHKQRKGEAYTTYQRIEPRNDQQSNAAMPSGQYRRHSWSVAQSKPDPKSPSTLVVCVVCTAPVTLSRIMSW